MSAAPKSDLKGQMNAKKESEIWLYSYADLITNLLAFFIMLLVVAKGGSETAQKIQESISKVVTGTGSGRVDAENEVSQLIKSQRLEDRVALEKTINGLSLTFSGGLFFDSTSAELTTDAKQLLGQVVPIFKKVSATHRIDVEGYADARPIRTSDIYPSNWELSAARAGSVVRFLAEQGIDSHRMRAIGYADTKPVSSDNALNRRVVISIGNGVK